MAKDVGVALFHGLRKQAIENKIAEKTELIEVIEASIDPRAQELAKKFKKELEGHKEALAECEAEFEEAVRKYKSEE